MSMLRNQTNKQTKISQLTTKKSFFFYFETTDGAEWLRTTDEVVHTWKNVSNLEPGTEYELRIKATNGKISIASGIDEVTTDGDGKFSLWCLNFHVKLLLMVEWT